MRASLLACGLTIFIQGTPAQAPLIVHEWGTITTRHAPNGTPQGRLNRIHASEVLPAFVHRYEPPATERDPKNSLGKSPLTPGRPDVTMRLETPVIYFYPPPGSNPGSSFDVSVHFRGGIVNEFYPQAEATVAVDVERVNAKIKAGLVQSWDGAVLNNYVVGGLRWTGLTLSDTVQLPATTNPVWLAPRRVGASGVLTAAGQGERYLFYRGVAHLDALVQTERLPGEVRLRAPQRLRWLPSTSMTISHLWVADIRDGGRAAFRERKHVVVSKDGVSRELARVELFSGNDHTVAGMTDLKRSMKEALVEAGLFDDEADAMLETWRESYFATPGLRVFYIVPREWTTYFLPLEISTPHRLTRVLMGRIDLEAQ